MKDTQIIGIERPRKGMMEGQSNNADEASTLLLQKEMPDAQRFLEDESCGDDYRRDWKFSGSTSAFSHSAPRLPRISFSEPPEELMNLTINDDIQLPPMDPSAEPSTQRYSLHLLLNSEAALPPVAEFRPRRRILDGRLELSPMRERSLHAPLDPGTPTRAQSLLALRDKACAFTAGFLARTGLDIPLECDPDIQSRRESNLSVSDLDEDTLEFAASHVVSPSRMPALDEEGLTSSRFNSFAETDMRKLEEQEEARGGSLDPKGRESRRKSGAPITDTAVEASLLRERLHARLEEEKRPGQGSTAMLVLPAVAVVALLGLGLLFRKTIVGHNA